MRNLANEFTCCSINTATLGFQAPISNIVEAVAKAGFKKLAPWRREVEGNDVKALARQIREAGLTLSGYCRSTYIPSETVAGFNTSIQSNKRALDDAATLGAPVFVMVVGSLPPNSRNLAAARKQVAEGIAELLDYGRSVGVRIGLEPLHPVYAADRSCLTLISEALDMCDAVEGNVSTPSLGVVIDCYHVWWDPYLQSAIKRAGNRILGLHVCDWLRETKDVLNDRGMMGDGVIDIQSIRRQVEAAGYAGAVEVEIFSAANWWQRPMHETLAICHERLCSVC